MTGDGPKEASSSLGGEVAHAALAAQLLVRADGAEGRTLEGRYFYAGDFDSGIARLGKARSEDGRKGKRDTCASPVANDGVIPLPSAEKWGTSAFTGGCWSEASGNS